jgi:hypothetical protein
MRRGDTPIAELVDVSPEYLDHFAGFLTGGVGRFLTDLYGAARKVEEGDVTPRDVPFVRQFYSQRSPFASGSEFRDLMDQLATERSRAKADRRLMPGELGRVYKLGTNLDRRRREARKEIDQLTGATKREAERALDLETQLWNRMALKAILETTERTP